MATVRNEKRAHTYLVTFFRFICFLLRNSQCSNPVSSGQIQKYLVG